MGAGACGRIGFDATGGSSTTDGSSPGDDAPPPGGDGGPDASQVIACADMNLGSATGANVLSGSVLGQGNDDSSCNGAGADVAIGWFAPAAGRFRFDLCGSLDVTWDSAITIRDGSCTGAALGCADDGCATQHAAVAVDLAAGQGVVIVVNSTTPIVGSSFRLGITQQ